MDLCHVKTVHVSEMLVFDLNKEYRMHTNIENLVNSNRKGWREVSGKC